MLAKKRKLEKNQKTPRQMERHLKGVANHWRISILFLISENEGISLDEINEKLGGNVKTISEHTKKLVQAGLVNKARSGRGVSHSLSPYGKRFLKFIKTF
ncbi:MAG: winged helix-turn-helix domain-containing protein [Parcubacteria group bacterium]